MPEDTVLTYGLAVALVTALGGGFELARRLLKCLHDQEARLLKAIKDSRTDGDKRIDALSQDMAKHLQRLRDHEIEVERRFVSVDTFNLVVNRLEVGAKENRSAIEAIRRLLSDHNVSIERRLAEIVGYVAPGALLKGKAKD